MRMNRRAVCCGVAIAVLCGCSSFRYSVRRRDQQNDITISGARRTSIKNTFPACKAGAKSEWRGYFIVAAPICFLIDLVGGWRKIVKTDPMKVWFDWEIVDQDGRPVARKRVRIPAQGVREPTDGMLRINVREVPSSGRVETHEVAFKFPEWRSKLENTGEAEEILPPEFNLLLRCESGKCVLEDEGGAPVSAFRTVVQVVKHRDDAKVAALKAAEEARRQDEERRREQEERLAREMEDARRAAEERRKLEILREARDREERERVANEERIRREQGPVCKRVIKEFESLLQSVAAGVLATGRGIGPYALREVCGAMSGCIKNCSVQKCGGVVPKLFGRENFVATCESLERYRREMLSP